MLVKHSVSALELRYLKRKRLGLVPLELQQGGGPSEVAEPHEPHRAGSVRTSSG